MANSTPLPSSDLTHIPDALRSFWNTLREVLLGRLNNGVTVTLTANAATTTVTDSRIGPSTKLDMTPMTALAATALATTYQTWPNSVAGQIVLNHLNLATTTRTFRCTFEGS